MLKHVLIWYDSDILSTVSCNTTVLIWQHSSEVGFEMTNSCIFPLTSVTLLGKAHGDLICT